MTAGTRRETHYDGRDMRCFADRPLTIDASFRGAIAAGPDRTAVIAGEKRLSYRALDEGVDRLSAGFVALGLAKGDRIALLMGNRFQFVEIVLAAARLGLIAVPLNVRNRRPELTFMLGQCGARALIYDAEGIEDQPMPADLPALQFRIALDAKASPEHLAYGKLVSTDALTGAPDGPGEEDPFCILYTSGTTGRPKGAVITHLGVIHSLEHYRRAFALGPGDVSALAVPASHVTGLVALVLAALHGGGALCIMHSFRARDFLALVEQERVTFTLMVPAMYNLCLLCPELDSFDLSTWRAGGFGGAPMPVATIERLHEAIPTLALSNVYGATETTSPVTLLPPEDALSHSGSVGRTLPCADIRVVDVDDCDVGAGERGELLIGGPMVIPRYWENAEADARSFEKGYWRSGDIGSVDADGYVAIHDRLKDVINRGGYKIYCVEVENVLAEYPGVVECAVFGIPDEVLGERVCAVLVGDIGDREALIDHCRARLADYKLPEWVEISPEPLPRNANGKILKQMLRRDVPGVERYAS